MLDKKIALPINAQSIQMDDWSDKSTCERSTEQQAILHYRHTTKESAAYILPKQTIASTDVIESHAQTYTNWIEFSSKRLETRKSLLS